MSLNPRYAHTNIVARDWRALADFYIRVFDCVPVPPERNLSGDWVDSLTSVEGAHIHGIHLRLPGYGGEGPTLEIFQYDPECEGPSPAINRPGLAHIAFAVDDVPAALDTVLDAGGSAVGETVTATITGAGSITLVYAADPEGNIIELQQWER